MCEILLIEDNVELANLIQAFLKKEGFSLCHKVNAEDALIWLQANSCRIILLDIMLPGMDGFAFCKKLRAYSDIAILIISAKSEKSDQLLGFELGADDYIQKPVDPDILCAKLHAMLHRKAIKKQILESGDLWLDVDARIVKRNKQVLELNVKEYELLLLFIKHPGKTLQKEYIFHQIWGMNSESESQTLTVHIKMLRSKIEDSAKEPKHIITVWGVGYRYEKV